MRYNQDQVVNGIASYANNEVINKLPTMGKWIVSAGMEMASDRMGGVVSGLSSNAIVKALGIIDDNGMIDVDTLAQHLKNSANTYGKATIDIPVLGKLTFSAQDIDIMRDYIAKS